MKIIDKWPPEAMILTVTKINGEKCKAHRFGFSWHIDGELIQIEKRDDILGIITEWEPNEPYPTSQMDCQN